MPSTSANALEIEIAARVRTTKLRARGLWWTMRDLIEQNQGKYPGDVRKPDGAPFTAEELADDAGSPAVVVLSAIQQLQRKGLVKVLGDGTIHSPMLARLQNERAGTRERKRRERKGKPSGVTSHPTGVTSALCHTDVTPEPPPDGFPPLIPPPSFPPPNPSNRGRAARPSIPGTPGNDPLDVEVREFIGAHRLLDYSPRAHADCRKLVESEGWDGAKRWIDLAIERGKTFPLSYALGMAARQQRTEAAAGSPDAPQPRRQVKQEFFST